MSRQNVEVSTVPGRVVIVNGASSVGKSTLVDHVAAARAVRGECWICVSIDDFNAKLPAQWFDVVSFTGPFAEHGVRFESSPDGLVVAVGDLGRRLFATYRRSVALWAHHGFNVLVDEVTFDEEAARDWDAALVGVDVSWVGLHCAPDVAESRERQRGDRASGLARGLSAVVHRHVHYDLELDSTSEDPTDLARQLDQFIDNLPRLDQR